MLCMVKQWKSNNDPRLVTNKKTIKMDIKAKLYVTKNI